MTIKTFSFDTDADQDILDWLKTQGNQSHTVRDALRLAMQQQSMSKEPQQIEEQSLWWEQIVTQLEKLETVLHRDIMTHQLQWATKQGDVDTQLDRIEAALQRGVVVQQEGHTNPDTDAIRKAKDAIALGKIGLTATLEEETD